VNQNANKTQQKSEKDMVQSGTTTPATQYSTTTSSRTCLKKSNRDPP